MSKLSNKFMVLGKYNITGNYKNKLNSLPITDYVFNFIEQHVAKRHSNGLYFWLPFGTTIRRRIETFIRNKQISIGGEEVSSNILSINTPFKRSKRMEIFGEEVFSFKGRNSKEYILCPTSEELFTEIFMSEKKSYKSFPFYFFQIGNKYRDEIRPRNSILRSKEFVMKDGYYFTTNEEDLENFYKKIRNCYIEIFNHFKIEHVIVNADANQMLGSSSEEFISTSLVKETEVVDGLEKYSGIEMAHIFNLGTKYSEALNCSFLNKENKLEHIYSGSYGIGINRMVFKVIENLLVDSKNCYKPFNFSLIDRREEGELFNIYNQLSYEKKEMCLLDVNYNANYKDRILSSEVLNIDFIIIEEKVIDEGYRFILLDKKTNERRQVSTDDIKNIMMV